MMCDHGVDVVWYTAMIVRKRKRETNINYKENMQAQFKSYNFDEITAFFTKQGGNPNFRHRYISR